MTPPAGQTQAPPRKQLLADGSLAAVTLVWGSTFVLVKSLVEQVTPMLFLAVRFGIAGVILALITLLAGRWRGLTWREVRWGALVGVALWAGYALQTLGLQQTTASNAGFITGMQVVIVPALGILLLRHRPEKWTWLGIALATIGLALLSLHFKSGLSVNPGDVLVLGCALSFAVHILLVARVATWTDPLRITTVQVVCAGLLNAISALAFEPRVGSITQDAWLGAAFLGVAATAAAFLAQNSVQRYTTAAHTALIFTLEPVFAAIFGYWLAGDKLTWAGWAGAALILTGMLVAELLPNLRRKS